MQIPWQSLSREALDGLIEEFITREGTEYGLTEVSMVRKVEQVTRQLHSGKAIIDFDPEMQTCNIVPCD